MAQGTLTANASASLTAAGTSTATGSITWTAPAFPEGVTAWDSVIISGSWSWGGKGSITRVTINGTNTSDGVVFSVSIAGKSSPLSITCVGNKNATGNSFTWSNLVVTYTYTQQGVTKTLTVTYDSRTILTEEVEPPVSISYGGQTIASFETGTKTLNCSGKVMTGNVIIAGHTLQCSGELMKSSVVCSLAG